MSDQNGSDNSGNPPPGGEAPPAAIGWLPNADAETVGYVQNKKWADPGALLSSYKNLETLVGVPADQIVRVPKDDTPEAWNGVYERLGRPKTADDYDIPVPEVNGDPDFAKTAKTWFHEAGLNSKQAKALAEKFNAHMAGSQTKMDEAGQLKFQTDELDLKKEWGAALDQNTQVAKLAAGKFGVPPDQVDALQKVMGYKATMQLFHKIGVGLGEDKFVAGAGDGASGFAGALTPGQATARIKELNSDPAWSTSYLNGDKVKLEQMRNLQRMANGG